VPADDVVSMMIAAATRAGFTALFTIEGGGSGAKGDRLRIQRYGVSGFCDLSDFADYLQGRYHSCQ